MEAECAIKEFMKFGLFGLGVSACLMRLLYAEAEGMKRHVPNPDRPALGSAADSQGQVMADYWALTIYAILCHGDPAFIPADGVTEVCPRCVALLISVTITFHT